MEKCSYYGIVQILRLGGNVSTYGTSYAGYTKLNSSYASKFYNGTETALSLSPGSNGDIWQFSF